MLSVHDYLPLREKRMFPLDNIRQCNQIDLMRTLVELTNVQKNIYNEVLRHSTRFEALEQKLDKVMSTGKIDKELNHLFDKNKLEEMKNIDLPSIKAPRPNYSFSSIPKSLCFQFDKLPFDHGMKINEDSASSTCLNTSISDISKIRNIDPLAILASKGKRTTSLSNINGKLKDNNPTPNIDHPLLAPMGKGPTSLLNNKDKSNLIDKIAVKDNNTSRNVDPLAILASKQKTPLQLSNNNQLTIKRKTKSKRLSNSNFKTIRERSFSESDLTSVRSSMNMYSGLGRKFSQPSINEVFVSSDDDINKKNATMDMQAGNKASHNFDPIALLKSKGIIPNPRNNTAIGKKNDFITDYKKIVKVDNSVKEISFKFNKSRSNDSISIGFNSNPASISSDNDSVSTMSMDSNFNKLSNVKESLSVLRKIRAVTIMANRLLVLDDEVKCYEEVSRLLIDLFPNKKCSFSLMTDSSNFTVIDCREKKDPTTQIPTTNLVHTGSCFPLKGTSVDYCSEKHRTLHTRSGIKSKYLDHKIKCASRMKSFINTPILLGGKKFAGCLNVASEIENGFTDYDIMLIQDIASTLGVQIYSKRLQKAEQKSHTVSKALLHSLIPQSVLSEIEHYWSEKNNQDEEKSEKGVQRYNENKEKLDMLREVCQGGHSTAKIDRNASLCDKLKCDQFQSGLLRSNGISNLKMISTDFDSPHNAIPTTKNEFKFSHSNQRRSTGYNLLENITCPNLKVSTALYAKEASNVSIIFTDIVGFSRISLNVQPIKVMDMLQDLFHRFDELCVKHKIFKLETIGDAYICAAGLFDGVGGEDGVRCAARRALAMAEDMVLEARKVLAPGCTKPLDPLVNTECLEIRAGIHVGDITYGVLGKNIPKLTILGNAVNLAARMEQTSQPSKVHVTSEFHDLIDQDMEWGEKRRISVKNMGDVETYLLDPLHLRRSRRANTTNGRRILSLGGRC